MRIQHNIPSMAAYRNYTTNVSALSKNLEKLSSGYKINRAGDDAAGLAISEKMRAQITGLETAQKNAKDGISLVQTAEGALTEVHDMLNRMYELAEQSANGTYADEVDREQLQKEIESLRTEINRIADSSNFNGINLLDGSLQQGNNKTIEGAALTGANLPPILQNVVNASVTTVAGGTTTPGTVGTGTILHKGGGAGATKTEIQAELHNVTPELTAGDKIKLSVGDLDIELTVIGEDATAADATQVKASEITSAEDLRNKLLAAFELGTKTIDGQEFTAAAAGNADNPAIKFTQANAPTGSSDTVDAGVDVKITVTQGAGVTAATDSTGIATGVVVNWTDGNGGTSGASTINGNNGTGLKDGSSGTLTVSEDLDENAIADAINALQPKLDANSKTTAVGVSIKGNDNGKLNLVITDADGNDVVIGTSEEDCKQISAADTNSYVYTFKDADGNALGSFSMQSDGTAVTAANTFATGKLTSIEFAAGSDDAGVTVDFSAADNAKLTTAATAAGAASGEFEVKADGADLALYVGSTKIATATFNSTAGATTDFKGADGSTILSVDVTSLSAASDFGANSFKTGVKFTAAAAAGSVKGTYNVESTMNVQGSAAGDAQLASTKFNLTTDIVKDGQTLTIGKETYVFKVGKDSTVQAATGQTLIDLKDYKEGDAGLLDAAGLALSQKSDTNTTFSIGYKQDGKGTISIHERKGQTDYVNGELESIPEFQKLIHANKAGKTIEGKSLMLQIGDTSDSFNQLSVDIKDCHADAIGIGDIDISTQGGASDAMNAIKNAINYVSDVRGDLGALQNRLDHTISNLSVMQENIQDAESTIRDVDVAKEMMEYTKNSILVQSAQAMLAQANQLPQGVLQLLG